MSITAVQVKCFMCQSLIVEAGPENEENLLNEDCSKVPRSSRAEKVNKTCPTVSRLLRFAENELEISIKEFKTILEDVGNVSRLLCQECDNLISVVCQLYEEIYGNVKKLTERLEVLVNFLESPSGSKKNDNNGKDTRRTKARWKGRDFEDDGGTAHKYMDLRRTLGQKCRSKYKLLSQILPSRLLVDSIDQFNSNIVDELEVKIEDDSDDGAHAAGSNCEDEETENYKKGKIVLSNEKVSGECNTNIDAKKEDKTDSDSEWDEGSGNSVDDNLSATNSSAEENSDSEKKTFKRKKEKNRSFDCDICGKLFVRKAYIDLHKEKVHKISRPPRCERPFNCEICNKKYKTIVSLQTHSNRIHGVRISFRNKRNGNSSANNVRMEVTKETDSIKATATASTTNHPFSCEICRKRFTRKRTVENHRLITHGIPLPPRKEKPHSCDICGTRFIYKSTLKRHKTNLHTIMKSLDGIEGIEKVAASAVTVEKKKISHSFSCDICEKTFTTKFYIELHKNRIHKIAPPPRREKHFKCGVCSKKYKSRASLQTHTNRVHGVRISFPPNTDKNDANIKMQIVDVIGDLGGSTEISAATSTKISRPFSCHLCKRKFTRKRTMEMHKEIIHEIPRPPQKEKQYSCDICGKKFISDSSLKRHKINVHNEVKLLPINEDKEDEKNHKCTKCPNSYKDKYTLERHLNRKHIQQFSPKAVKFACSQCPMQFSSRRLRSYHVSETHITNRKTLSFLSRMASAKVTVDDEDEINEVCVVCQIPFKSWDLLRKHLEHHEVTLPKDEKCKKCYFCNKNFAHEQTIWAHLRSCITHDYTKVEFPCDHELHFGLPQWSYKTPTLLENHIKEQHNDSSVFLCTECNWPFLDRNMLDLHRLSHLPRVKSKYQCPTCHNFFLNAESLRNHYNVQHGVSLKFYRCQVCNWGFSSKNGLAVHMNHHGSLSGETGGDLQQQCEFQCTECPKSYPTAIQLRDHKRNSHVMKQCQECGLILPKSRFGRHVAMNHQGAGNHLCTICGKVYRAASSLKKHMTSHGFCQYNCEFCGKKYSVGKLLKIHVARYHSGGNTQGVQNVSREDGGAANN